MIEFVYKTYQLTGPMSNADLEWMRNSGIDIRCETPYEKVDSGWVDYSTEYQIVTGTHKFTAYVRNGEQDTWLSLYWGDRAKLISYMYSHTCKYDDIIKGEENVID